MVYLQIFSIAKTAWQWITGWSVNNNLEIMCQTTVMTWLQTQSWQSLGHDFKPQVILNTKHKCYQKITNWYNKKNSSSCLELNLKLFSSLELWNCMADRNRLGINIGKVQTNFLNMKQKRNENWYCAQYIIITIIILPIQNWHRLTIYWQK